MNRPLIFSTCAVFALSFWPGTLVPAQAQAPVKVVYSFLGGDGGQFPGTGLLLNADGSLIGGAGGGKFNGGVLFKVSPGGQETVMHSFGDTGDGTYPEGGLIADKQGNIYGTTYLGGAGGYGTVFRLGADGGYTLLYSFTGGSDGGYLTGTLTEDKAGNLYGTAGAGANDLGIVFKITPGGQKTTLWTFTGPDGAYPLSAHLALDARGNLYGTTAQGGANGNGTIFMLTPKGKETVLHSFTSGDGGGPQAGLVADKDGNFYGTTSSGGANLSGTVFKFTPPQALSTLYAFAAGKDGYDPISGVTLDKSGHIFGTTFSGGKNGGGTVFALAPDGTRTLSLSLNRARDGAPPVGSLALDRRGNLFGTAYYGGAKGASDSGTIFEVKQ